VAAGFVFVGELLSLHASHHAHASCWDADSLAAVRVVCMYVSLVCMCVCFYVCTLALVRFVGSATSLCVEIHRQAGRQEGLNCFCKCQCCSYLLMLHVCVRNLQRASHFRWLSQDYMLGCTPEQHTQTLTHLQAHAHNQHSQSQRSETPEMRYGLYKAVRIVQSSRDRINTQSHGHGI
jgi:hypothetical protein